MTYNDHKSPEAKQWAGWGSNLKPAWEPIILARKPISEKTIAQNVLKWGTGGINIDGCRIPLEDKDNLFRNPTPTKNLFNSSEKTGTQNDDWKNGRWPANILHDGSEEVEEVFPQDMKGGAFPKHQNTKSWKMSSQGKGLSPARNMDDEGSASRFFYCSKASKKDRDEGLEEELVGDTSNIEEKRLKCAKCGKWKISSDHCICEEPEWIQPSTKNFHATVKPTKLMQYLCKLITPPNGTVLDPFMGSGSTGKACKLEGFNFTGIELDVQYCDIARKRIGNI